MMTIAIIFYVTFGIVLSVCCMAHLLAAHWESIRDKLDTFVSYVRAVEDIVKLFGNVS